MPDLGNYPQNRQFSFGPNMPSITTGNPMIDGLISMLMQGGFAPRPTQGQSVMEAFQQRERSQQFLQLMTQSFGQQQMFAKLGGMSPTMARLGAIMTGGPDGLMDNPILRAINAGNPMKEQMALFAGMKGSTMAMGFGRFGNGSLADVQRESDSMTRTLFHTKQLTNEDFNNAARQKDKELSRYLDKDPTRRDALQDYLTKDASGNESLDRTKLEEARKASQNFTKKFKEGMTDAALAELKKVDDMQAPLKDLRSKIDSGMQIRDYIDPSKSRGFATDDLASANLQMMDNGMTGDALAIRNARQAAMGRGLTGRELWHAEETAKNRAADQRNENTPRILSATSDFTGAKNAKEASTQFNDLWGMSKFNAGNDQDANYAVDLQRRVKATTRIYGMSIDAMMSTINMIKAEAMRHPQLQNMGGVTAMEASIKAVDMTHALSSSLGSSYIRSQGGTSAVLQTQAQLEVQNRKEEVSQNYYGIYGHILTRNDLSPEKKKELLNKLQKYIGTTTDANGRPVDHSASADSIWMEKNLGKDLGLNANQLVMISKNNIDRQGGQMALEQENARRRLAGEDELDPSMAAETTTASLFHMAAISQFNVNQKGKRAMYQDGKKLTSEQMYQKMMKDYTGYIKAGHSQQEAQLYISSNYGMDMSRLPDKIMSDPTAWGNITRHAMRNDPEYKQAQKDMKEAREAQAGQEEEMDRWGAKFKQSPLEGFMQTVMSGRANYNTLLDQFGNPVRQGRIGSITKSLKEMADKNGDSQSLEEAYQEQHGGIGGVDKNWADNMRDEGRSQDEINEAIAQRHAYEDPKGRAAAEKFSTHSLNDFFSRDAKKIFGDDYDEAMKARDWFKNSGLVTDDVRKKYGKRTWAAAQQDVLTGHGLNIARKSLQGDIEDKGLDAAGNAIDADLKAKQGKNPAEYEKEMAAMNFLGIGSFSGKDKARALEYEQSIFSENTFGALHQHMKDGTLDVDALNKDLKDPAKKANLRSAIDELKGKGYADKDGNIKGEALGWATGHDDALNKVTDETQMPNVKKNIEAIRQAKGRLDDTIDPFAQAAKDQTKALGNMVNALTSNGGAIVAALNMLKDVIQKVQ